MIKPTLYLSLLITFLSMSLNAQNPLLEKVVYSAIDSIPIENVHITTSGDSAFTNVNGFFKVNFNLFLELTHIGYGSINYNDIGKIPDTIWMKRSNIPLDDITINSKREIKKIEKLSGYEVKNFEVFNDQVIVFKKSFVGGNTKLALYDLDGNKLDELDFDYNFENIITNCIGQVYLKDKHEYFLISVSNDELWLESKTGRKDFEKLFDKCVLYNNGQWIYEYERSSGLERNIVSIRKDKDVLLKKIVLDEKLLLKRRYQWEIDLGAKLSNITTNDADENAYIRNRQEESDYLDKVLLKAHENNSFAVLNEGILIANSLLDSLHFIGDNTIDYALPINKQEFIFNNVEKSRAYFFQKGYNEYVLSEISHDLKFQKFVTIAADKILKVRISGDHVFYLTKESSNMSVRYNLYFEKLY